MLFGLLAAAAFAVASLIGFGAVTWLHFEGWYVLGFAFLALHFTISVSLPPLVRSKSRGE